MSIPKDTAKSIPEQIKDIRDHAYNIAEGQSPGVQGLMPLIDMLAILAQSAHPASSESGWEYNVIDEANLLTTTRCEGWELVTSVVNSGPMSVARTFLVGNPPYTSSVYDQEMGQITRYLVRRRADSPITLALERVNDATTRATQAEHEARQALARVKALEGDLEAMKKQNDYQRDRNNELLSEKRDEEDRNRRLEKDIAKIRQALGGIRMKEILES